MWKLVQLSISAALILGGIALMILFQHQTLSVIWTDPISIFWSDAPLKGGLLWWIGPMFIFTGVAIIAEDYFGFGQPTRGRYSKDSASQDGMKRDALPYEHDRLEPPRETISRSQKH